MVYSWCLQLSPTKDYPFLRTTMVVISALMFCAFTKAQDRIVEIPVSLAEGRTEVDLKKPFTSLSLKGAVSFDSIFIEMDGIEYLVIPAHDHGNGYISNLTIPFWPFNSVVIINYGKRTIDLTLQCYDGRHSGIDLSTSIRKRDECDLPLLVSQEVWRKDLPDPAPNPTTTQVSHLIVHHSATPNGVTDYVQVVRDIYLYHINTNGWDDVGYNYLIAPDGTLFAGRDGQGKEDDNIKGAHFCGKNSYTMGVCLVGNYSQIPPTDTMMGSLVSLLAWKIQKEALQPLEDGFHPRGSDTGFDLPIIAGHRDGHKAGVYNGCQTECPGNHTYEWLPKLRENVALKLLGCDYPVNNITIPPPPSSILVHGSGIQAIDVKDLEIFDGTGRRVRFLSGVVTQSINLDTGLYFVRGMVSGVVHRQAVLIP